jgi:hypothetical protein
MRFDRLRIEPNERGSGHRLTAIYSTFGGGRITAPVVPEGRRFEWRYSNTSVTVEIPANVRETRVTGSGESQTTKKVWVSVPLKVEEFRSVWTLAIYDEVPNIRDFEAITIQMNRVHWINGRQRARFASASVNRDTQRDRWYNIEYTWEIDTGTPKPNEPGVPRPDEFDIIDPLGSPRAEFYRFPYESFVVIPSPTPETQKHDHIVVFTHRFDANGHLTLPGVRGDE